MDKFPLAAGGWTYLIGAAILAWVATALGVWVMAVPLWLASAFIAYFFRDPPRSHSSAENKVISPADGKVVVVQEVDCPRLPGSKALLISVFMNVFNVHVNRIPIDGRVLSVDYKKGGFVPADRFEATHSNERLEVLLELDQERRMVVTQVAGMVARRIECRLTPGNMVKKGDRYGMIRFGSRLDLYLPPLARSLVQPGQIVKAGISEIAEI